LVFEVHHEEELLKNFRLTKEVTMATQDKCCTIVPYFKVHSGKLEAFKAMCEQFVEKTNKPEARVLHSGVRFSPVVVSDEFF
jgi:hypothetical protein